MSRDRPISRCTECGNVLKMDYVGPDVPQDPRKFEKSRYLKLPNHG